MSTGNTGIQKRGTFWALAAFYMLIAFEFFYMASPFAIYFYSVYKPALDLLNKVPGLAWLVGFFLPHIVLGTSSALINLHSELGAVLAVGGLLAFSIGASQVYWHKLTKKGAVTGGIYKVVRHPQYASLIISGVGLLLLWPRYIVLVMFVTMLFAYRALARIEERECETRYGQPYRDYKEKTAMFLPFRIPLMDRLFRLPASRPARYLALSALYIVSLVVAVGLAWGTERLAVGSLYAFYSKDAAYISVAAIEPRALETIVKTALADPGVQTRLGRAGDGTGAKFLNYVLPTDWYVPEIPMYIPEGEGHSFPSDYDKNLYKIVFTRAEMRAGRDAEGRTIITDTARRTPVMEVWVDLAGARVIKIEDPPKSVMYESIPVAVY